MLYGNGLQSVIADMSIFFQACVCSWAIIQGLQAC